MTIARENIHGEENLGAHRNYMIVDCDGHWYDGWERIVFKPTAPENSFLLDKWLWTENTVYFKYYVHPNRWQSIFSAQHLLKLLLVERLDEEATFYRNEMKRLALFGFEFPKDVKATYEPPVFEGEVKQIDVHTIEFALDRPEFYSEYKHVQNSQKGLIEAYERQKYLTHTLKPQVRFCIRANEAAYFSYGIGRIAPWMEGRTWEEGWRFPKGKVDWNFMRLGPEIGLRYRIKTVSQQVSAE